MLNALLKRIMPTSYTSETLALRYVSVKALVKITAMTSTGKELFLFHHNWLRAVEVKDNTKNVPQITSKICLQLICYTYARQI